MYTILGTPKMIKWLDDNLKKYEEYNSNEYVVKSYSGKTIDGGSFCFKLYNSNLITINGSLKDRMYKALFLECGEENYTGCDEVGVGDFFGPTVYVSVTLTSKAINFLADKNLPIRDSKKLTDQEIIDIYKIIIGNVDFSQQIVFDSEIDSNLNSIAQKSFYHNENVKGKDNVIIDLFTTEKSFYKYTNDLNLKWGENLILQTKADSIYMSVALASIIARALFLIEMDKLNKKYQMIFPFGAGNVLPTAREFVSKYSKDELATFCKITFKTFDEI